MLLERTEEAANKTMDAVEAIFPVVDSIQKQISTVNPLWQKLMHNDLDVGEFKAVMSRYRCFTENDRKRNRKIHALMTDVLMAQDFQDLTGQVIRKVIDLVREVEDSLINMLTAFGLSSEEE